MREKRVKRKREKVKEKKKMKEVDTSLQKYLQFPTKKN